MRIRPYYPCTLLSARRESTSYALRDRQLDTSHRVHARRCRFRRLRRARRLTMSKNLALFALDCFVQ
eukprot:2140476-Prymnesium_polylepis.1